MKTRMTVGILSLLFGLVLGCFAEGQRTATARARIENGKVVAISIIDPGSGYEFEPKVEIVGGGGFGARGQVVLQTLPPSVGTVSYIHQTAGGYGYTSAPEIEIESPSSARVRVTADMMAKAKAQAELEAPEKGKEAQEQQRTIALTVFGVVMVFVLLFISQKLKSKQKGQLANLDVGLLARKFWKPIAAACVLLMVGSIIVIAAMKSQENARKEAAEAKALSDSTITVTGSFGIGPDNEDAAVTAKRRAESHCYATLDKQYEDWKVVTKRFSTDTAPRKSLQAKMDDASRVAIATGASRGQHTEMLRETIVEHAYAKEQKYAVCTITVTQLKKKKGDKPSAAYLRHQNELWKSVPTDKP